MKKRGLFRYIIPLLLIHSTAFATDKGFYVLGRKSAGFYDILNKEESLLLQPKQIAPKHNEQQLARIKKHTPSHQYSDSESSNNDEGINQSNIRVPNKINIPQSFTFKNQLLNIIKRAKGYREPSFASRLKERVLWDIAYWSPYYGFCELGGGYYFKLMMPFALEIKGLCEHRQAESEDDQGQIEHFRFFFGAISLKGFLPLGDQTKLYLKIGKNFLLNASEPSNSMWPGEVWDNISKHWWSEEPFKMHWLRSRTFLGAGIITQLSSKIELDISCEGYTTAPCHVFCYTFSVGINYLL